MTNRFNFERQEDIKKKSYLTIDNNENKKELNNFLKTIPYRICFYGYLDPGKEVFDFLKNSALCELIDETALVALTSFYDYCFFSEKKSKIFGSIKKIRRALTENQIEMLDAHYYDSKSVLRYRRGFQRVPVIKDDRLIKYEDGEYFTSDSCSLFSLPDYKSYKTSCNGWAKKNILGEFSQINTESHVDTYYDFLSSKMMDACKDGNYDFMQSLLYYHIMSNRFHVIEENGKLKHDVRTTALILNMIIGSTPEYNLDEIRKIMIGMHNNQIFVNFIILGVNFSDQFLKDIKIISDYMPNARLVMYPEKNMLNDRRGFWNNKKMIDYLSTTPSFESDTIVE